MWKWKVLALLVALPLVGGPARGDEPEQHRLFFPLVFGGQPVSVPPGTAWADSFEAGLGGWTVSGNAANFAVVGGGPDGGRHLEAGQRSGIHELSRPLDVPAGCVLSFWWRMENQSPHVHDFLRIGIRNDNLDVIWERANDGPSTAWERVAIALPPGRYDLVVQNDVSSWRLWLVLWGLDGLRVNCE